MSSSTSIAGARPPASACCARSSHRSASAKRPSHDPRQTRHGERRPRHPDGCSQPWASAIETACSADRRPTDTGRPLRARREREVGEARHLEIRAGRSGARARAPARGGDGRRPTAATTARRCRDSAAPWRDRGCCRSTLARGLRASAPPRRAEGLRRAERHRHGGEPATAWSRPAPARTGRRRSSGSVAGEALGDGDVRRRSRRSRPSTASAVADTRASSASVIGRGREGAEQVADRRHAAVEDQRELVVGEQARRVRPVAGGLGVADRLHDVAVLLVPLTGDAVEGSG